MTFENTLLTEDDWLSLANVGPHNYPGPAKRRLESDRQMPGSKMTAETPNAYAYDYSGKRQKVDVLSSAGFPSKSGRSPTVGELAERGSPPHVYDPLGFTNTPAAASYFASERETPATPPQSASVPGGGVGAVAHAPVGYSTVPSPPLSDQANLDADALNAMAEKYMYFYSESHPSCELYDAEGKPVSIRMVSKLRGNWHLTLSSISSEADNSSSTPGSSSGETKQLTFYRRNLFSLDSTISASGVPSTIISPDVQSTAGGQPAALRERLHIAKFTIGLQLLSSTRRKRQADLVDRNGGPISELDVDMHKKADDHMGWQSSYEWEKIKFSSATINNGAPNQQPYFEVGTVLKAITTCGQSIVIAQATSRPIIVRGRHPRFYKDRFGISLNGEGASRRSSQASSAVGYRMPAFNGGPISAMPYISRAVESANMQPIVDGNHGRNGHYYPGVTNGYEMDPNSVAAANAAGVSSGQVPLMGRAQHSYEYFPLDQESGKGPLTYGYYYPHLGHLTGSESFLTGKKPHRHFYKPLEFVE